MALLSDSSQNVHISLGSPWRLERATTCAHMWRLRISWPPRAFQYAKYFSIEVSKMRCWTSDNRRAFAFEQLWNTFSSLTACGKNTSVPLVNNDAFSLITASQKGAKCFVSAAVA
eukprot:5037689-Pyramimonas_sp.AAC.1